MTAEQWSDVERHFAEIHGLPPSARDGALSSISDEQVRREVVSLLASATGDQGEVTAAIGAMVSDAEEASARPPVHIGPYLLLRRIGQGGQGSVFEAMRDDGVFEQHVAIKVIKWETDSDSGRDRFRQERQILAGLSHPHIARLFDGGETEDGLPYLVMELVDGKPLTEAARDWPARRKLELFLQLASAIAYAHANLVVHRDLKPGNILVAADGTPKLLDFGIAKLLDPGAEATQTALQVLTPAYASPEQIRGQPISTRTDVYSLGVVLYELMTGRKPYTVDTATFPEMSRLVCEQAPEAPGLDGELDAILLMALRKEPERRYDGVKEFADDVKRYLDRQPVMARPDTILYRSRKYMRRHWVSVLAAALTLTAIAVGTGVALHQARLAQQRFNQVRKLARTFVFDIHDEIAKVEGTTVARELVVKTALEYLDQLNQGAAGDPGLQLELADAYVRVAEVQGIPTVPNLGHTKEAIASYSKAEELHRSLASASPSEAVEFVKFEGRFGNLFFLLGDVANAEKRARAAVALGESLLKARDPAIQIRARVEYAMALHYLSVLESDLMNNRAAAIEHGLLAAKVSDEALKESRSARALVTAMAAKSGLVILGNAGRLREALHALDEQEALLRELLVAEPRNPRFKRGLAVNFQDKSLLYFEDLPPSLENAQKGAEQAEKYLAAAREMVAADAKDTSAQFSLAMGLSRLGSCLRYSRPAEAVKDAREAMAILERLHRASPQYLTESRIPHKRGILALVLLENRMVPDAVRESEQAVEESRQIIAKHSSDKALVTTYLLALYSAGRARQAAGNLAAADHHYAAGYELADREFKAKREDLELANATRKMAEGRAACAGSREGRDRWSALAADVWQQYTGGPNEFIDSHRLAASK